MENKTVKSFEDLDVWKEAMQLTKAIYTEFNKNFDFTLREQIRRSAVSIPSNIAEGFDRQTNKEFIHFLYIAKASCSELQTQLYIVRDLEYIETLTINELIGKAKLIARMLGGLIKYRKSLIPQT